MSPLSLLFFQTEQSQFSAAPHKMLQTLHQNCCISLDMLQGFDVFLIMKRPKLNTVRLVWPHQGWVWTITSLLLLKHYLWYKPGYHWTSWPPGHTLTLLSVDQDPGPFSSTHLSNHSAQSLQHCMELLWSALCLLEFHLHKNPKQTTSGSIYMA